MSVPFLVALGLFIGLVVALQVPAASAQMAKASVVGDSSYVVTHYAFSAHDFVQTAKDVGAHELPNRYQGEVTATLRITAPGITASGIQTLTLYANIRTLDTLTGLTDAAGAPLAYTDSIVGTVPAEEIPIHRLAVRLAHPVAVGDTLRLTLRVRAARAGITYAPRTVPARHPFRSPTPVPWDLSVTVPEPYQVLSQGRRVGTAPAAGGQRTVHWRQPSPGAAAVIPLKLVRPTDVVAHASWSWRARRVPIDVVVETPRAGPPVDTLTARGAELVARAVPRVLDTYTRVTGVPYPWEYVRCEDGIGMNSGWFSSGGDYAQIARWGRLFGLSQASDDPPYLGAVVAHELAHSWFAGWVFTRDDWLDEGAADILVAQYLDAVAGPRAKQEYLWFGQAADDALAPESGPLVNVRSLHWERAKVNPYFGGRIVLSLLEQRLGARRFRAGLERYARGTYPDLTATTQDFRRAMEQASGEDLGAFFDQWVYSDRRPALHVTAAYDTVAHRLTLQVAQTQGPVTVTDDPRPRERRDSTSRDSVPTRTLEAFRLPVTIRVATARGALTRRVLLDAAEQTIAIEHVPAPPAMVVFDDRDELWKSLTFPQPTAWLVTQLREERTPWQTAWAIGELRARGAQDSIALAALRQAATRGRAELTRAQATRALAALGVAAGAPPARSTP